MVMFYLLCYWAFGTVAVCAWWRNGILDLTLGIVISAALLGWISGPVFALMVFLSETRDPNRRPIVIWKAKKKWT